MSTAPTADPNFEITGMDFVNSNEGFFAFRHSVAYTTDNGRTYTNRAVTPGNVNFNGASVNLTFGFSVNGVKALSSNSILLFGEYGAIPAILRSDDQGRTFTLIYHAAIDLDPANSGILKVVFPGNSNTGYAIEPNRIIKTSDRGASWSIIYERKNADLKDIEFPDLQNGYVLGADLMVTTNGGTNWINKSIPGFSYSLSFFNGLQGYISTGNYVYFTPDAGTTWTLRNDSKYFPGSKIYFINEKTGYSLPGGFEVQATSDSGRTWENVKRDNKFEYLGYGFNCLNLAGQNGIYAAGFYGHIEYAASAPPTLPSAAFTADYSVLNSDNILRLVNLGKPTDSYRWYKQGQLISTSFEHSYVSDRASDDLIRLVAIRGNDSVQSEQVVSTAISYGCDPDFTSVVDTGSVKFSALQKFAGMKHAWDFGDGTTDSINHSPFHRYKSPGVYSVRHWIESANGNCSYITYSNVTIVRTTNCLPLDFNAIVDTFYQNAVKYSPIVDVQKTELNNFFPEYVWSYGTSDITWSRFIGASYTYPGTYTTCVQVTHPVTGCVSRVCKPVTVFGDTSKCDPAIKIYNKYNKEGYAVGHNYMMFEAKPQARSTGKRHTWTFFNQYGIKESAETGNSTEYNRYFYSITRGLGTPFFNEPEWTDCDDAFEYCLDSLLTQMRHTVYDSLTGCTDSVTLDFTEPRSKQVFIDVVQSPVSAQNYTFKAYIRGASGEKIPYAGVWYIPVRDWIFVRGGEQSRTEMSYSFKPGRYKIYVGDNECTGTAREVWYTLLDVKPDTCQVHPFNFVIGNNQGVGTFVEFFDDAAITNERLGAKGLYYFGDGDSAYANKYVVHKYSKPGTYKVTLRYTGVDGCAKEFSGNVVIAVCDIVPRFTVQYGAVRRSDVTLTSTTTGGTAPYSYKWNIYGKDTVTISPSIRNVFHSSSYRVLLTITDANNCKAVFDTTLTFSDDDICEIVSEFTVSQNLLDIMGYPEIRNNNPDLSFNWKFGDGQTSQSYITQHTYNKDGKYNICLAVSNIYGCKRETCKEIEILTVISDDVTLNPNPVSTTLSLSFSVEEASAFDVLIFNQSGVLVRTEIFDAVRGVNTLKVNVANLKNGLYTIQVKNGLRTINRRFLKV